VERKSERRREEDAFSLVTICFTMTFRASIVPYVYKAVRVIDATTRLNQNIFRKPRLNIRSSFVLRMHKSLNYILVF